MAFITAGLKSIKRAHIINVQNTVCLDGREWMIGTDSWCSFCDCGITSVATRCPGCGQEISEFRGRSEIKCTRCPHAIKVPARVEVLVKEFDSKRERRTNW